MSFQTNNSKLFGLFYFSFSPVRPLRCSTRRLHWERRSARGSSVRSSVGTGDPCSCTTGGAFDKRREGRSRGGSQRPSCTSCTRLQRTLTEEGGIALEGRKVWRVKQKWMETFDIIYFRVVFVKHLFQPINTHIFEFFMIAYPIEPWTIASAGVLFLWIVVSIFTLK